MAWFIFIILAVATIGGGLAVVVSRNVVHAALALLVSLILYIGISYASKPPDIDPRIRAVMDI